MRGFATSADKRQFSDCHANGFTVPHNHGLGNTLLSAEPSGASRLWGD
jgi:hypothetical protein